MRVIAIGGVPATGKTTLMKAVIEELGGLTEVVEPVKLVTGHFFQQGPTTSKTGVLILGRYDPKDDGTPFLGTDRMSMAVQPMAKQYIEENKDKPITVIFEGDRLFNHSFLEFLYDTVGEENLFIMLLQANQQLLDQRHIDRQDNQDKKFLNGRKTKYDNIASDLVLQDRIRYFPHENQSDTRKLVDQIMLIADPDYNYEVQPG